MSRWKAGAIHFLISVLIVSCTLLAVSVFWYPPALWRLAELGSVLKILIMVDVVTGPVLTTVVFNPAKRSLKFDLAVIALMQVAAFAYGVNVMFQSRPVFLLAGPERFELVFASELKPEDVSAGAPGFDKLSWFGPKNAAVRMPESKEALRQLIDENMSGRQLERMPKYFIPIEEAPDLILDRATPLSEVPEVNQLPRVLNILLAEGLRLEEVSIVYLDSARGFAAVLINSKTAALLAPVDINFEWGRPSVKSETRPIDSKAELD